MLTAPLTTVTDGLVLATLADGVLLVVRWRDPTTQCPPRTSC
ncbi:MAG: hypothetical protein R2932_56845 [Caldilineaceae bacterium]